MGLYSASRRSAGNCYKKDDPVLSTNPNPDEFKVTLCKQIGSLYLSVVHYPNCTNYEGKKILLTRFDPRTFKRLDPHFSRMYINNAGLIARFVPTEYGWECGYKLAKMLENGAL